MIDWKRVSPQSFEKLCAELLEFSGFQNIQWYGAGGGDSGRDIVATKNESPVSGTQRTRKWVVQCKRFARSRVSKQQINEFLTAAREHEPDAILLVVATTLTPQVRDWLEAVRKDYRFEICTWEEKDLEREIARFRTKLSTVPPIIPKSKTPVCFSLMPPSGKTYYGPINWEFEEIGFYLMNSYGPKRDKETLEKFINFIRHNEVVFEDEGEEIDEQ